MTDKLRFNRLRPAPEWTQALVELAREVDKLKAAHAERYGERGNSPLDSSPESA